MAAIRPFREKLAYKSLKEGDRMIYEWVRRGQVTLEQFRLLAVYYYTP